MRMYLAIAVAIGTRKRALASNEPQVSKAMTDKVTLLIPLLWSGSAVYRARPGTALRDKN